MGRFGIAAGVGALALLVAVLAAWAANRGWLRDHDRLLGETVRISRGDLGRPVTYGCILLSSENAQTLYNWAEAGVVVEVIP